MAPKYIFVTGGVISSPGKRIISSSLAYLLKARGLRVAIQKFDPYINTNSGTLNPYEYGESYVTVDGHEGDMALGDYERFTDIPTTRANSITLGRIYQNVINKERRGEYSGRAVQVIPHVTDEIKSNIKKLGETGSYDFVIIEIGGAVGDIESLPFLESVRQLRWELGGNSVCIHLEYLPCVDTAKEMNIMPTQYSVKKLQELGVQPDVLVLRTERNIDDVRQTLAMLCNVTPEAVVQLIDEPTVYEVPVKMYEQHFDVTVLSKAGVNCIGKPDIALWKEFLKKLNNAEKVVRIGLVGKYVESPDAYKSINEALIQSAAYNDCKLDLVFIQSEKLHDGNVAEMLSALDGVLVAPGSGQRGVEGKNAALKWCRENNVPTFGIGLGVQCMVVEFARNVAGFNEADSAEMVPSSPCKVIDSMVEAKIASCIETTRLGAYDCIFNKNSRIAKAYNATEVSERHHNLYEVNVAYRAQLEENGLVCSGINPHTNLIESVEIPDMRWYIGVQYHPEYSSTVLNPHPLFVDFVRAAVEYSEERI